MCAEGAPASAALKHGTREQGTEDRRRKFGGPALASPRLATAGACGPQGGFLMQNGIARPLHG